MFGRGAALRALLAAPQLPQRVQRGAANYFTAGSRYQIRASWGLFGRSLRQGDDRTDRTTSNDKGGRNWFL